MKKRFLAILLTLIAAVALLTVGASAAEVTATYDGTKSAVENGTALFGSIMGANDGDTVTIPAGTYELTDGQTSRITGKSVTLVGAGQENTIIQGQKYGLVIQSATDGSVNFTIKDMTVKSLHSWGHAIYAKGNTVVNLENVTLTNPGTTVILVDTANEKKDGVCATVNATNVTVDENDKVELLANPCSTTSTEVTSYAKFNFSNCTNIVAENCQPQGNLNLGVDNLYVCDEIINPAPVTVTSDGVTTGYATLAKAVAAAKSGDAITILQAGTYTLPEFAGKELTFKGVDKETTSINDYVTRGSQGMRGSTVHFEDLTINGATTNYIGLYHTAAVTYKNCNINGLRFLYAPTVSFEDCAFNANGVEHSFWTYGASNVTVTNCTFTYTDRAVNCYSESGANHETDISFSDCKFTYAGTADAPEGAVEINSASVKSIDVTMDDCTAPAKGAMWFISRWDSKTGYNTIVEVDDEFAWRVAKGGNIVGYTKADRIWGETWGNAVKSYVVKVVDAEGNVMGTSTLNNIGGIIDGDVSVTWSLKLKPTNSADSYWNTVWTTAPSLTNVPTKVQLWIDDTKVSEGDVKLNGPDNLNKIVAAVVDADGKIVSYATSVAGAVESAADGQSVYSFNDSAVVVAEVGGQYYTDIQTALDAAVDGGTITLLADVTADSSVTINKSITLDGNGHKISGTASPLLKLGSAANITVKNVTLTTTKNVVRYNYVNEGYTHTYQNCQISGGVYGIHYDGNGGAVVIDGCTIDGFNTFAGSLEQVTVKDTTFDADQSGYAGANFWGNAVIENVTLVDEGKTTWLDVIADAKVTGGKVVKDGTELPLESYLDASAKIGSVYYDTLQDAIDAAVDGDTITLLADCAANVTVTQAPDVAITIDGNDKTMTGSITVDGKSHAYETAALTIQNVNFEAASGAVCINLGVSGDNNTRYTSNVTVDNCTFTGTDKTAAAIKSYTGGDKNLTVTNCTATGMHSLVQLPNVAGVTISGCTVTDGKNGISLGRSSNAVVSDCEVDVIGYGIRADANAEGACATITDCEIDAFIPVVVRNATQDYELTFSGDNTMTAANTDGYWCVIGATEYETNGELPAAATGEITATLDDAGLAASGIYMVREENGTLYYNVDFVVPAGATFVVKNESGATVAPDGDIYALANGTYTVTVSKDGYYDATKEFTVEGPDTVVTVELEKIPTAYRIKVADAENGTVSTDYKSARAGRKVTVTVAADEKYIVKGLTVATATGREIAVTDKGDGTYTFTMPGAAVTITGEFGIPFTDIEEDHKFYEAIEWVYTNNLMIGKTETTFDRASDVTRQQVWRVLARVITGEDTDGMAGAKAWAIEQGISDGSRPGEAATREEFITMMWIAFGKADADTAVLEKFSDADAISAEAKTAMAWAVEVGITEGYEDGTMRPAATTTRGAFAAVLYRYLSK